MHVFSLTDSGFSIKTCDLFVVKLQKDFETKCKVEEMDGIDFIKKYKGDIENDEHSALILFCPFKENDDDDDDDWIDFGL